MHVSVLLTLYCTTMLWVVLHGRCTMFGQAFQRVLCKRLCLRQLQPLGSTNSLSTATVLFELGIQMPV